MTEYVLGFAFGERKGRPAVLLVQKSSPEWQAGKYNGVGGKIEIGETPIDAMCREFLEETGIGSSEDDWTERLIIQGAEWRVIIFKCERSRYPQLARQITKKDRPIVAEVGALPENVIPNLRWIIPFLMDPEFIQGNIYYPSLTQGTPSVTTEL